MAVDTQINREQLIHHFPELANDAHFRLLSDVTRQYNCIGWAMGSHKRWVTSTVGADYWWPNGVERNTKQETLVKAFEAVGFSVCADSSFEAGYDKVALYGLNGEWKHASRIISNTEEYSKFGWGWDAVHGHNVISGTVYGDVYCYMKRPVDNRYITEHQMSKIGTVRILRKLIWK